MSKRRRKPKQPRLAALLDLLEEGATLLDNEIAIRLPEKEGGA